MTWLEWSKRFPTDLVMSCQAFRRKNATNATSGKMPQIDAGDVARPFPESVDPFSAVVCPLPFALPDLPRRSPRTSIVLAELARRRRYERCRRRQARPAGPLGGTGCSIAARLTQPACRSSPCPGWPSRVRPCWSTFSRPRQTNGYSGRGHTAGMTEKNHMAPWR
jgi:hypothetical protein